MMDDLMVAGKSSKNSGIFSILQQKWWYPPTKMVDYSKNHGFSGKLPINFKMILFLCTLGFATEI